MSDTKRSKPISRRNFIATTGVLATGSILANPIHSFMEGSSSKKIRLALVGTGKRGTGMFGETLKNQYSDYVEFVGLSDKNIGRLKYAQKYIGTDCPIFTHFEEMMRTTKPDVLVVTTTDSTHDTFIIKGMEMGADIISEKPMTTDEHKCQAILDAEKRTGKKVTVTFNYRYAPYKMKIKELMMEKRVGDIVSVDFHWYLNTYHGASYFRRWHGERKNSGTLLVHKSTHHFDLLNWWLDSEPEMVFALGDLEFYGKNNSFRGNRCLDCEFKTECGDYYYDIKTRSHNMKLYVENEKYDGYIHDGCIWRKNIDIYDKMSLQIKHANKVLTNYSLTTYSPYEGFRISFNGTKGRIEAWEGIPWQNNNRDQRNVYATEMSQKKDAKTKKYDPIMVMDNFGEYEEIRVPHYSGGHGGGDSRLLNYLFINPDAPDPLGLNAGTRDGSMSILTGIAARNSIESKKPIFVNDLTDLTPRAKKR